MSGICDTFSGSIRCDVLTFNPDAIPKPDTLHISMTRGESRIADELHKSFGGFERVIIDVDGEQHEFNADSFIGLIESYAHASRWHELFGTPERAARIVVDMCNLSDTCAGCPFVSRTPDGVCGDYYATLEWLEGDAE